MIILVASLCLIAIIALVIARSLRVIGPSEIGLVNKRFARRSLADGNPVAFHGEAGYQAELLMPGLRFKLWPVYTVGKHPWVQVPAGTNFHALPWKSMVDVPWQLVPGPAAQSFMPFSETP